MLRAPFRGDLGKHVVVIAADEGFIGQVVVLQPAIRVGDVAHLHVEHGDRRRGVLDEGLEPGVRASELLLRQTAVGHVDVGIHVAAAGYGHAADLEHLAGELLPLVDVGRRAQKRLEPVGDHRLDLSGTVVAPLGPEAHELLERWVRVGEERFGHVQQRPVELVAGSQPEVAVDQRDAAGEVVDHHLQRIGLSAYPRDVGADGDEAVDRAVRIKARNDDRFEPDLAAALGAVAELAAPRLAGTDDRPHFIDEFARVPSGAQQVVVLSDKLLLAVAGDVAEAAVDLQQAPVGVRHGNAEMLLERLPVGVEAIGRCAGLVHEVQRRQRRPRRLAIGGPDARGAQAVCVGQSRSLAVRGCLEPRRRPQQFANTSN